jgi:hypothetical protein
MNRALATVTGLVLLGTGLVLTLYGLFAILYRGDSSGGDTHVDIAGNAVDADIAGVIALLVALLALVLAVSLLLGRRVFPRVKP